MTQQADHYQIGDAIRTFIVDTVLPFSFDRALQCVILKKREKRKGGGRGKGKQASFVHKTRSIGTSIGYDFWSLSGNRLYSRAFCFSLSKLQGLLWIYNFFPFSIQSWFTSSLSLTLSSLFVSDTPYFPIPTSSASTSKFQHKTYRTTPTSNPLHFFIFNSSLLFILLALTMPAESKKVNNKPKVAPSTHLIAGGIAGFAEACICHRE